MDLVIVPHPPAPTVSRLSVLQEYLNPVLDKLGIKKSDKSEL